MDMSMTRVTRCLTSSSSCGAIGSCRRSTGTRGCVALVKIPSPGGFKRTSRSSQGGKVKRLRAIMLPETKMDVEESGEGEETSGMEMHQAGPDAASSGPIKDPAPGMKDVPLNPLAETSSTTSQPKALITIQVKKMNGICGQVKLNEDDTLLNLKEKVFAIEGDPIETQRCVYNGKVRLASDASCAHSIHGLS